MAVPVRFEPGLETGNPAKLFTVPLESEGYIQCRLVATDDGRRFLGSVQEQRSQADEFSVITAWTTDLKIR